MTKILKWLRCIKPYLTKSDAYLIISKIRDIDSKYIHCELTDEQLYLRIAMLHRRNNTFTVLIIPIAFLLLTEFLKLSFNYLWKTSTSPHSTMFLLTLAIALILSTIYILSNLLDALTLNSINSVARQYEIDVIKSLLIGRKNQHQYHP